MAFSHLFPSLHPNPRLLHDQLSSLVSHSGVDGTCQPHSTDPTTLLSSFQQALEEADHHSTKSSPLSLSCQDSNSLLYTWGVFLVWSTLLDSYLKILRCSVACALSLSPSFTLGVGVQVRRAVGSSFLSQQDSWQLCHSPAKGLSFFTGRCSEQGIGALSAPS